MFLSKILPSLNDFRSFVEESEHMVMGSMMPNFVEGHISSKEKIDIEMGNRLAEDTAGYSLPEILRNLEFDDFEGELMIKQEGEIDMDSLFLGEQDMKPSDEVSIPGGGTVRTEQSSASKNGDGEFMEFYSARNETDTSGKPIM